MPCITAIRQLFCRSLWLALGAVFLSFPAAPQGIESIMAPGKVITAHVKVEDDCKQCHVKFDRKAQDGQCMTCHKDVGADLRRKGGFHGRLTDTTCRSCHTDHKGRDVQIASFDVKKFDHSKTDFALRGKHDKLDCVKCHLPAKKYREASLDCSVCHKKDDVHKGSLGKLCADCHSEANWKDVRFDHGTTKFPLTGKHVDVVCADCHKTKEYKETPGTCYACHRKVDDQKGHKGHFGEKCDTCHTTKAWKPTNFNHDTDTKYLLRGKHSSTACTSCHTADLYRDKLSQDCYACHKKDDKHNGTLGQKCASCHTEKSWKESPKFDHNTTDYPLLGKHANVECKGCHSSPLYKEAPRDCFSCHIKDDKHKTTLGKSCSDCHNENAWKSTQGLFDHDKTKFALRNGHAKASVQCVACHKDLQSFRNTPLVCQSCHNKDDKHEGQLGSKCDTCHNDKAWKGTSFNHGKSVFPLTGRHIITDCNKCHLTLRYKDAAHDCYACHKKDDKHKQVFGVRCESCHSTRAWSTWSFDHDTRTKYRLEAAHAKATCEACHKQPAPAGLDWAPLGSSCFSCHRANDVHNGTYGPRCEQCHTVQSWKLLKNRVNAEVAKP